MIGGIDTHISTQAGNRAIEAAVRAVRQCWQHAVYENGDTGERYSRFMDIPFGIVKEIFVYRDCKSADAWESQGATPELSNTMVHIIIDDNVLTVVVDDIDVQMTELLAAVSSAVSDDILSLHALLEAA